VAVIGHTTRIEIGVQVGPYVRAPPWATGMPTYLLLPNDGSGLQGRSDPFCLTCKRATLPNLLGFVG